MKTFALLVGFVVLGIALGSLYARLDGMGAFQPWGNLGTPPEGTPQSLSAGYFGVYIAAPSGRTYACYVIDDAPDCWSEVPGTPTPSPYDVVCATLDYLGPRPPRHTVATAVSLTCGGECWDDSRYALQ